jgi:hypothetical protein
MLSDPQRTPHLIGNRRQILILSALTALTWNKRQSKGPPQHATSVIIGQKNGDAGFSCLAISYADKGTKHSLGFSFP